MKKISPNHPCLHGLTVKQRKEEVLKRLFPDYKQRQHKARRRVAIVGLLGILVTGFIAEDHFLIVLCACVVGLAMMAPYAMNREG